MILPEQSIERLNIIFIFARIQRSTTMNKITEFFEKTLTELVVSITPFVASIIPAIFLFINLTRIMGLHGVGALLIAAAAEGIGIGSISIYYKAKQFNRRYKDEKNHVSEYPPLISYTIYLTAIILTNVLLEAHNWHESSAVIQSLAIAFLSLLSLSGALLIATNNSISMVENKNARSSTKKASSKSRKAADRKKTELDSTAIYSVSDWRELSPEMKAQLQNGHSRETLKTMFPEVTGRTVTRWKEYLREGKG